MSTWTPTLLLEPGGELDDLGVEWVGVARLGPGVAGYFLRPLVLAPWSASEIWLGAHLTLMGWWPTTLTRAGGCLSDPWLKVLLLLLSGSARTITAAGGGGWSPPS